jgi:hypothetical protein
MEDAGKASKRIRRICGKYLSVYGEYGNLVLFRYTKLSPIMQKVFEHENTWKESQIILL